MRGQERLASYLQSEGVQFFAKVHPETFTAQETAQSEHVPGQLFAKVVIVMADDQLVMLCLPATHEVDLDSAAEAIGANELRLAAEEEFSEIFEDCEVGAMPPFGNLYGVPVWVDETLAADERIVFNAGTHHETFEMDFEDYRRLVEPQVAGFSRRA